MTREEILAMEAGRKLDGLVGKEVMGLEVEYPYAEGYPYVLAENKEGRKVWDAIPFYSTDILAAWQVVEKMPPPFQIHRCLDNTYWVVFGFVTWMTAHINSKTAPEAICKAALLAKLEMNTMVKRYGEN